MQPSVRTSHSCCVATTPVSICSVAKALEVIGERWSLLIVRAVMHGNRRFGEMQGRSGSPATSSPPASSG